MAPKERKERKRDTPGGDMSEDESEDDRPLTRGGFRNLFRELMTESLRETRSHVAALADNVSGMAVEIATVRSEVATVRSEVASAREDFGALASRVTVLESSPPHIETPGLAPGRTDGSNARGASGVGEDPWARAAGAAYQASAPHAARPPAANNMATNAASPVSPPPVRIEFTNCHDFGRRMQEAFDEPGAHAFLRALMEGLRPELRQALLPDTEQFRRNSRALIFVPVLHVRPNLAGETREAVMEALRAQLSSGAFDRHGRRPRARWELRPDQRPLNKLLGMTYRLTEALSALHPSLARWKVQPAGRGVEFWLLRDAQRPALMGKIDDAMILSNVGSVVDVLTASQIQEAWREVSSS